MSHLDDFTLTLGRDSYLPLMVGGMGVDTSTPALAYVIAQHGGIAHISDAMLPAVVDRHAHTHYVDEKRKRCQASAHPMEHPFDLEQLGRAIYQYVSEVMNAKRGSGGIFLNIMEKLTMGNSRATLQTRLLSALDAGIDGITLAAGLHIGSLDLMRHHQRFHDVKLGIIVSSARALKLFMKRAIKAERLPDYIVVEGPLAGGHLGFPLNWQEFDLATIVADVQHLLQQDNLRIPVIAAGGIFNGADAVEFLQNGAAAVQVATRFAVTRESGLPDAVKQAFFAARPEDVEVNLVSPTGYPMRMLKQSPAIGSSVQPICDAFGYVLEQGERCPYRTAYEQGEIAGNPAPEKICLCAMMFGYKVWTCGHHVSRLKDTTRREADGTYVIPTAEEVFLDYMRTTDVASAEIMPSRS